ncbi:hypothetical protein PHYC_02093 [Phycisphaerales bacterium]|nr:hypothetical protein PHYC_02093 [Phycisphaerales bacterium]
MSISVLVQVHEEVRRLAIAGGAVAGGDFRLRKLIAPLEQAGAKAPVFGRVAQAAQAVVDSNEKTASAALLDLATLVNAILYTQGETGAAGEHAALETTDLGGRETQTSARVLKPLLEALASTGSGRLELIRDAVERGTFKDLRLVRPALKALDDPYPEIAGLLAEKVLPMYGGAIVPELRTTLDLKGRGGHLHRLRLLHKLDPEGSREIVRRALDEGSKEIRVAAIECLDATGPDLGLLLEHVKAKARDVRAAALRALSATANAAADVVGALKRAIDGADLELFIDHLRANELPEIRDYVLAKADQQLAAAIAAKDAKQQGPAIERLQHLVLGLEGRSDADAEAFLLRCFEQVPVFAKMKSEPSGQDFNELLARVLARGTPRMQQRLVAAHKSLSGMMLEPAFDAARETMTPASFYEEFRPLLAGLAPKRGRKGPEQERAEALASVLMSGHGGFQSWRWAGIYVPDDRRTRRELDPRWLDAAIGAGAVQLVCRLARAQHSELNQFLSEQFAAMKPEERHDVLYTMVRVGHPGAADAIIDALKQQAKASHHGYYWYWYDEMIAALPKVEYTKFEAVLPTLPEKMVDRLMGSVLELKNKPE